MVKQAHNSAEQKQTPSDDSAATRLQEEEALLAQELAAARERHLAALNLLARKEAAAAERVEELEAMIEELGVDQKRSEVVSLAHQLTEKKASLAALNEQWDSIRGNTQKAQAAADALATATAERLSGMQSMEREVADRLSTKKAELEAIETNLAAQLAAREGAGDEQKQLEALLVTRRRELEKLTAQLEKLQVGASALVPQGDAQAIGLEIIQQLDVIGARPDLVGLRLSLIELLGRFGIYEYEVAPWALVDEFLTPLITVAEHQAGRGERIVIQTLVTGFQLEREGSPAVCLRRAEVITGCTSPVLVS
jgi:chromosome segregation ATPase